MTSLLIATPALLLGYLLGLRPYRRLTPMLKSCIEHEENIRLELERADKFLTGSADHQYHFGRATAHRLEADQLRGRILHELIDGLCRRTWLSRAAHAVACVAIDVLAWVLTPLLNLVERVMYRKR